MSTAPPRALSHPLGSRRTLRAGVAPHKGMRRSGRLTPVRRGVYRDGGSSLPSRDRYVLAAHAADPDLADDSVFSHVTAAVLHGLPVWSLPLTRLHVARSRTGGGRVRRHLHVHPAPLPPGDVVSVDGLRVTSPARTAADLARTVSAERALVVTDAILHRAVVAEQERRTDPAAATVEEITDVLTGFAGRRGSPSARRLVAFADGRAESPGESRSRLLVARAGLPAPVLQWTPPGTSFRCDFAWPDVGVVGEFDGRIKYGRSLAPEEDPAEAVWREKLREDRIRELGYLVVRWIWDELTVPGLVGERIGTALGRRRA